MRIKPEITSLFKTALSVRINKALAGGTESKPAGFNDPLKSILCERTKACVQEQEMDSRKIISHFGEDMSDVMVSKNVLLMNFWTDLKSGLEKLGILSLASSNKNLLMWSHYASEHKGMCLEFNASRRHSS